MGQVVRLICRDCLRPVEPGPGGDAPSSTCGHCGGPIEAHTEELLSEEYETPLSLLLTPESLDSTPWDEPLAEGSRAPGPTTPQNLGRFQLRELLGGGGFGQVFRAYDPRLDRVVALKVLKEPHPTGRVMERFFREARAAAQLDHPNIVPLHDAGRDQGRCWIAYQFVEGRTLGQYRDLAGAVDFGTVARLVRDLADALDHAHRRGVFHRDLKPSNIIIDGAGRPRLTDFGLARRAEVDAPLTAEGAVLGTPVYMSPEQASGRGHLADARSDVYSLGVIFYELLCGRRPGDLASGIPAWRAERQGGLPIVPPRSCNPHVPRPLDRICRKAMAADPADRYCDARSLAEDLDAWLNPRLGYRAALLGGILLGLLPGLVLLQVARFTTDPTGRDRGKSAQEPPRPPAASPVTKPEGSTLLFRRPASTDRVLAIPGSLLFHRADCIVLQRPHKASPRTFANAQAARDEGMHACVICKP